VVCCSRAHAGRFLRVSWDSSLILVVFAAYFWPLLRRKVLVQTEKLLSGLMVVTGLAAAFVIGWGGFGAFFIRISALSAVVGILGASFLVMRANERTKRRILV